MVAVARVDVGFIGLGVMGQLMALNLVRAGVPLIVWNRTEAKAEPLRAAGARVATCSGEVLERAALVVLMLADGEAIDSVLARGSSAFAANVAGHTIVHMGTTSPAYSRALAASEFVEGARAFAERRGSG